MADYPSDWLSWAQGVLSGIGAQATDTNLDTLWAWSGFESGNSRLQWWNPLNTTQPAPGATNANSVGVKVYPDLSTGIQATVQTLLNGFYGPIVSNLQNSVPRGSWGNACQALGTWGSGCNWLGITPPSDLGSTAASAAGAAAGTTFPPLGIIQNLFGGGAGSQVNDPLGLQRSAQGILAGLLYAGQIVLGVGLIGFGAVIFVIAAFSGSRTAQQVTSLVPLPAAQAAARVGSRRLPGGGATAAPAASETAPEGPSPAEEHRTALRRSQLSAAQARAAAARAVARREQARARTREYVSPGTRGERLRAAETRRYERRRSAERAADIAATGEPPF